MWLSYKRHLEMGHKYINICGEFKRIGTLIGYEIIKLLIIFRGNAEGL